MSDQKVLIEMGEIERLKKRVLDAEEKLQDADDRANAFASKEYRTDRRAKKAESRGRRESADHACAVIDAHSEYDQNLCCDGRECCCGGESVHDHMKARIQALININT